MGVCVAATAELATAVVPQRQAAAGDLSDVGKPAGQLAIAPLVVDEAIRGALGSHPSSLFLCVSAASIPPPMPESSNTLGHGFSHGLRSSSRVMSGSSVNCRDMCVPITIKSDVNS